MKLGAGRILRVPMKIAAALAVLVPCVATPALAIQPVAAGKPDGEALVGISLALLLGLIACAGLAAMVILLRILLPSAAHAGDAARQRVGTKGLLLGGVLPLLGAGLIAQGVGQTGSQGLGAAFALLIALPLSLALILGALSAVPYIGERALRSDSSAGPMLRTLAGALVVGFAMVSWAIPPLGLLVSLLLAGWFLATGLGAFLHKSPGAPSPSAPPPSDRLSVQPPPAELPLDAADDPVG